VQKLYDRYFRRLHPHNEISQKKELFTCLECWTFVLFMSAVLILFAVVDSAHPRQTIELCEILNSVHKCNNDNRIFQSMTPFISVWNLNDSEPMDLVCQNGFMQPSLQQPCSSSWLSPYFPESFTITTSELNNSDLGLFPLGNGIEGFWITILNATHVLLFLHNNLDDPLDFEEFFVLNSGYFYVIGSSKQEQNLRSGFNVTYTTTLSSFNYVDGINLFFKPNKEYLRINEETDGELALRIITDIFAWSEIVGGVAFLIYLVITRCYFEHKTSWIDHETREAILHLLEEAKQKKIENKKDKASNYPPVPLDNINL